VNNSVQNSKIAILPENLANKIAAGEVVERPASAVKELVENAIDADATKITIHIEQGGKKNMQIVDNGIGMNEADLELAFERHATSKIKTEKDLHQIETLGFRGEALPSIASVAQIEIKSRTSKDKMGSVYTISGGKDARLKKTAANVGTSITVKNLFFNTPARRQFLRADSTENQQILSILKRFFLAYPNITFELWMDGKILFNLKECEIDERVKSVFGESVFQGLLPVNESLGGIELSGFISRPDIVRRSRGNQHLFLNGRPIHSKSLSHAVFQAYANLISAGEFPFYCLFLEMDPSLADVNVHPAKMEVRFSNDRSLYYFFINSIQSILKKEEVMPEFRGGLQGSAIQNALDKRDEPRQIINEMKTKKRSMARYSGAQLSLTYFEQTKESQSGQPFFPADTALNKPEQFPDEKMQVNFWQIHNRYIISEIKSGMVIIDQHVAHERVLYEKITKILQNNQPSSGQNLLFPQKISLNYEDFMVFKEIKDVLTKIGFSIKVFSGNTIIIEAMPADVKVGRESQILLDIIDYYRNRPLNDFNHSEKIAAAYACRNAIKSGETLTHNEMQNLIDQLFACETPFFCPHGRPVIVTMGLEELDRKFKRIT